MPYSCAYARTILEQHPNATVLMVEIGSQDDPEIGAHQKNSIKYQKDIDKFGGLNNHCPFLHFTYTTAFIQSTSSKATFRQSRYPRPRRTFQLLLVTVGLHQSIRMVHPASYFKARTRIKSQSSISNPVLLLGPSVEWLPIGPVLVVCTRSSPARFI